MNISFCMWLFKFRVYFDRLY